MWKWPDCEVQLLLVSIQECPGSARRRMSTDFLADVLSGIQSGTTESVGRELALLQALTCCRTYDPLIDSLFWREILSQLEDDDENVRNAALEVADNLFFSRVDSRADPTTYEDVVRIHKAHASNLRSEASALWADKLRCIEFYRGVADKFGIEQLSDLINEEEMGDLIAAAADVTDAFSTDDIALDEWANGPLIKQDI
jgi:hypothetical protein